MIGRFVFKFDECSAVSAADVCLSSELCSSVIRAETVNLFLKEVFTVIYTDALLVSLKMDVSVLDSWDEDGLASLKMDLPVKDLFLSFSLSFFKVVYSPVKTLFSSFGLMQCIFYK